MASSQTSACDQNHLAFYALAPMAAVRSHLLDDLQGFDPTSLICAWA
jgi:hypothetical protein